jgi:hypothetical protein
MASAGLRNPPMTQEELQGSQRNADTLKAASRRIGALAASRCGRITVMRS